VVWYGNFKPSLEELVGFEARKPLLRSRDAYDLAYDVLYDLLPVADTSRMRSVFEAVRRCDTRLRRLAGPRVRPGFSLDELDGVAGGISEIDRPPACVPANLALDLDP